MAAYGDIPRPSLTTSGDALRARAYFLPNNQNQSEKLRSVTVLPLDAGLVDPAQDGSVLEGVLRYLSELFDVIVEDGRTYPQETPLGLEGFKKYFLSHDFFVGIINTEPFTQALNVDGAAVDGIELESPLTLASLIGNRNLSECLAGMYYIKPNYPGRSSHCCNGGFVVDHQHRGHKIGKTLAKSYLHYAPRLGYRASVFNLVYTNNLASIAIWDSLGFKRVGLIPEAGRLKSAGSSTGTNDPQEEWIDAIVYWKKLTL